MPNETVTFQGLIHKLLGFWMDYGCVIQQPYDLEVGAGTMHPETFLRVLGPQPYRVAYVQPSRRPADGRYGENPNRLYKHYQLQVILKPSPDDVQEVYLASLKALGIELADHDLRFEEDNWESPTLGAWGIGWQVLLDGLEITQFTYFQQAGGQDLMPISAEITYGLERIATFVEDKDSVFALCWSPGASYGQVRQREEREFSKYSFEVADTEMLFDLFARYEKECQRCLDAGCVLPAYDYCLRCSHTFNLLDSRGAISVTERVGIISRVRNLAVSVASAYVNNHGE
ncbi:MAG TPA: glycine--tRNA ligase subunit alpha [Acidobacteriota bacterium]|nr:glycine--tRNA ligase subunit alpha [Acidobacteriota bacterium]